MRWACFKPVARRLGREAAHARHVAAAAEAAAGAGQDDRLCRCLLAQQREEARQLLAHLGRERIEFFRAVQNDSGDAIGTGTVPPAYCTVLIGFRLAKHPLGDVGQDQLFADRRDARDQRFPQ